MFVSASKDSTLKVWNIKTRKLMHDLPGHSDEVFLNLNSRYMLLIGVLMEKKLCLEEKIN
jgi:WD40 repeat protein